MSEAFIQMLTYICGFKSDTEGNGKATKSSRRFCGRVSSNKRHSNEREQLEHRSLAQPHFATLKLEKGRKTITNPRDFLLQKLTQINPSRNCCSRFAIAKFGRQARCSPSRFSASYLNIETATTVE
jgi:hypothetical protein